MKTSAVTMLLVLVLTVPGWAEDGPGKVAFPIKTSMELNCPILDPPVVETVGNTTCGGGTSESAPVVRWENVDGNRGYRFEVRRASGTIVDLGFTAPLQNKAQIGPLPDGAYSVRLRTRGGPTRDCDGAWGDPCSFTIGEEFPGEVTGIDWWPQTPKVGEPVRFVDLASGDASNRFWDFGDGASSDASTPLHVYDLPGEYLVVREVELDRGFLSDQQTIVVAGEILCGDGSCDAGETVWSCAADCRMPARQTGRALGSDRRPSVPVATNGLRRVNRNRWYTEGWVHNPGSEALRFVVEYTPLGSIEIFTAGPFELEPGRSMYWDPMVESLFGRSGSGSLWVDASEPVLFATRTYVIQPEAKGLTTPGAFGGSLNGRRERMTIGRDDGRAFITGLREDAGASSDLHLQNIDRKGPISVAVTVHEDSGVVVGQSEVEVKSHGMYLASLRWTLGVDDLASGYATVEVVRGAGRLSAAGTVVDLVTGDPTFIEAVHPGQVAGIVDEQQHTLVAAVAQTVGNFSSEWRSRLLVLNPGPASQEVVIRYVPQVGQTSGVGEYLETTVEVGAGKQAVWPDVLQSLLGLQPSARTQGALHVHSPAGLIVGSRTVNLQTDGGSFGLSLPGLKSGDLVPGGGRGVMVGLAHSDDNRTNLGFAAYSGGDTELDLHLWSTVGARQALGSIEDLISVPAGSHTQVPRVFEFIGLGDDTIEGIEAAVAVTRGGAIYPYATVIDNISGDPTAFTTAVE